MTQPTFQKSTAREYFESIVVAVILALFIRTFVVQAFKIPTGSMEPNLLVGDHLLVNKFVFAPTASPLERTLLPMRAIRRGDVIVFKFPEEPERDFIKRRSACPVIPSSSAAANCSSTASSSTSRMRTTCFPGQGDEHPSMSASATGRSPCRPSTTS